MARKHRATGNPRGRPPKIPAGLEVRIMDALRRRIDPETGLVQPHWEQLARELGVSRSTIARHMVGLRLRGMVESVADPRSPNSLYVHYRLKG